MKPAKSAFVNIIAALIIALGAVAVIAVKLTGRAIHVRKKLTGQKEESLK